MPFSWGIDLMGFPKAYLQPISPPEMISNLYFLPLARRMGEDAGVLIDAVRWGAFTLAWEVCMLAMFSLWTLCLLSFQNYDYMLYTAQVNCHPCRARVLRSTDSVRSSCMAASKALSLSCCTMDRRRMPVPSCMLLASGLPASTRRFTSSMVASGRRTMPSGSTCRRPTGRMSF